MGIGDSLTLHQIALFDWLYGQREKYRIENPFERLEDGRYSVFRDYPNEWMEPDKYQPINRQVWECARRTLLSDVYITGANAVTRDGQIVSVDGIGNRTAAMIYGPYKVILVIGRNKIVSDVDAALDRIRNIATPWNNYRHFRKHSVAGKEAAEKNNINKMGSLPCVQYGYCKNCNSPLCPRHVTVVLDRDTGGNTFSDRIHVILVNEDLGC